MMLVHLGLPQWQLLFTPMGPTPWARQVINLIAPHLLVDEDEAAATVPTSTEATDEYPVSALDPSVFRSRSRGYRKTEDNSNTLNNPTSGSGGAAE